MTKRQFGAGILILVLLYVVLLGARVVYELSTDVEARSNGVELNLHAGVNSSRVKNVASERKEYAAPAGVEVLDQKYERIASISSRSARYDEDVAALDGAIEQAQAVVQQEVAQGLPGSRSLERTIGVKPQFFDQCQQAVSEIGTLLSATTQKIDKTYEYRQLLAEKSVLEKRRDSYMALRERGGDVGDLIQLEDKIIEVESQLLQQSVDLGEYSDDNALCTIHFALREGNAVSVSRKLWAAFTWASGLYFVILVGVLVVFAAAYLFIRFYLFLRRLAVSGADATVPPKTPKKRDAQAEA